MFCENKVSPRQLKKTHFDLALELTLEATPDDFPLTGLETIGHRWNRPHIISVREQNELLVDELGDANLPRVVVQIRSGLKVQIQSMQMHEH